MSLWQILISFPTSVPTVFLVILLIYWLFSMIGFIDMGENLEMDGAEGFEADSGQLHDLHADSDSVDIHSLAGYFVAMGLGGVPFSIAASLLVFFTWLTTALLHQYVLVLVPGDLLKLVAGTAVLLVSALLAIPISARLIRPLRPLFVKHHAHSNSSLVGLSCRILTQNVDEKFGRAEVRDSGVTMNIRVWARSPNALTRDSLAVVLSYDDASQQYEVQALPVSI